VATGVQDLKVYQEAVALGGDAVRVLRQATRREVKAVVDHVMLTALAVAGGVAEGYASLTPAEQRRCYRQARLSLAQLESSLAIARHAELLRPDAHARLSSRANAVARLLAGYLSYLERQLGEREARAHQPLAETAAAPAPASA
jgi:four helix bundle protein